MKSIRKIVLNLNTQLFIKLFHRNQGKLLENVSELE